MELPQGGLRAILETLNRT